MAASKEAVDGTEDRGAVLLGTKLNEISRELHVSKRRVIMTRTKAEEAGYLDGSAELPPYPEALFAEGPDGRALRGSPTWRALGRAPCPG